MTPLGHAGIGIAGDVFDYRIIDRAIAPLLGKGDTYRIMGKPLPVPPEYYSGFARWHLLSLMRTPRTLRAIAEVARTARASRAPAPPDRADRGRARLCAVPGRLRPPRRSCRSAETTMLRFRHKDFVVERADHPRRFRRLDRPRPGAPGAPRSIRC